VFRVQVSGFRFQEEKEEILDGINRIYRMGKRDWLKKGIVSPLIWMFFEK